MSQHTLTPAALRRRLEREAKGIYWDEAWGLVDGCTPVSPACQHCWAAERTYRFDFQRRYRGLTRLVNGVSTFTGEVRLVHEALDKPVRRRIPTIYAVWCDLFHEGVPDGFIHTATTTMMQTPWHTYLLCTKRPGRMADLLGAWYQSLPNVIPMTTAENQEMADLRLPELMRLKGYRLGVSVEPMLGPVFLTKWLPQNYGDGTPIFPNATYLNWVICGAETGPHARPMKIEWARHLQAECQLSGAAFYLKKLSDGSRLLDGREWSQRP